MIRQERVKREEIIISRQIEVPPADGQVILFEQFTLLRRTWKWVLLVAIIVTAGVGAYVYLAVTPEYLATVRALPPNKSGTPLDNLIGGMASSLRDFGLSKLVGNRTSDNGYAKTAFINSQRLMDSLIIKYDLYTVYDIPKDRPDLMYTKLTSNMNMEIFPEGPVVVEIYDVSAKRAADMANDVIYYTNVLAREVNRQESEPITKFVGSRYEQARLEQERIGEELRQFMQKTKVYDPEVQGKVISTAVAEAEANVAVQRGLVEAYTKALGAEDPRTVQSEILLRQAEATSRRLAVGRGGVLEGPSLEALPTTSVQYLKLRQDYEVTAKVIALLQPLYEQTQFEEMRDIPVLNVLDKAYPPPVKARPRRALILASAFVGTFLIAYLMIGVAAYYGNFKRRYRAYMAGGSLVAVNGDGRLEDRQ